MEKEVIVRVLGHQYDENDSDEMEVVTTGTYYHKNGNHYIIYEEMLEGFDIPTRNVLKINDEGTHVKIIKRGVVNAQIELAQGRQHQFVYTTPYGEMAIDTQVETLDCEIGEDSITFSATYEMKVNYEYVAHNLIHVVSDSRR